MFHPNENVSSSSDRPDLRRIDSAVLNEINSHAVPQTTMPQRAMESVSYGSTGLPDITLTTGEQIEDLSHVPYPTEIQCGVFEHNQIESHTPYPSSDNQIQSDGVIQSGGFEQGQINVPPIWEYGIIGAALI